MSIPPQEPNAEAKLKEELGGGGPLSGVRQWLVDSYNGLYVIVLKPSMPEGMLYGLGILGLLFGLFWAYMVQPAQFTGGNPNRLNAESQQQWLQLVAVSASTRHLYAPEEAIELVKTIPNPRATITALLASGTLSASDAEALQALYNLLPENIDAESAQAVSGGGFVWDLITGFLIPFIIMIIIIVAGVLLWRLLIYENMVAPVFSKIREVRDPDYARTVQEGKERIRIAKEQNIIRKQMQKEAETMVSDLGAPVMQNLAIFTSGRSFDESYEVELESGEFLGQSGANVSEDVAPDPVAIDVWLFDIFDSMTLVKTFITPQGSADPNIRSRVLSTLNSPNDLVVASPDAVITIDSPKLRLQASFNSLEINEQGRFSNFKMVMRAWQKDAAGAKTLPPMPTAMPTMPAPMPTGAPPMSTYEDIQFDPPPAPLPPASGGRPMSDYDDISFDPPPAPPPPASGGRPMSDYDDISFDPPPAMPQRPAVQPLQPPPLRPQAPQPLQPPPLRRPEDDDPFGGTGDFTPLNG